MFIYQCCLSPCWSDWFIENVCIRKKTRFQSKSVNWHVWETLYIFCLEFVQVGRKSIFLRRPCVLLYTPTLACWHRYRFRHKKNRWTNQHPDLNRYHQRGSTFAVLSWWTSSQGNVLSLFRSHWLAVVHFSVICIGSFAIRFISVLFPIILIY